MGSALKQGKSMRLCVIANPNSVHVRRWVGYFARRGHEVHLVGARPLEASPPEGITFHDATGSFRLKGVRQLAWALTARRIVRQLRPDLVHSHFVDGGGWFGAASGWHPFVVTAHGSDLLVLPERSRVFRILARWVLGEADYVTCVSDALAARARVLGVPDNRLEVVPLGVDLSVFHPIDDTNPIRRSLNLSSRPVVASIRPIQAVYNPLQIAQAIPLVLEQVPETQFLIQLYRSEPELFQRFEALVRAAGAEESIRYVDPLVDDVEIARILQCVDVAVSVASSDGTPKSVQEAMACGAAMVLGDIPALEGWVRDGHNALVVPFYDSEAVASAIVRLLQDGALRRLIADRGVETVQLTADSRVWMKHYEAIYQRMTETGVQSGA